MIEAVILLGRLLLGLAALVGLGYVLISVLAPALTIIERLAAGLGAGVLVVTLWMLALSGAGLHLSLSLILLPLVVLAAGLLFLQMARGRATAAAAAPAPPPEPYGVWDWVFIGLLAALFLFVIPRAVMYPVWAWDAISTWGFKGRVFYLRGAVDLGGFEAHNYYPNLVPLLTTYLYLCLGQVNDHMVKLVFPLWGGAFLVLLFALLRRLGLSRTPALGLTAFFALNGVTFITHLFIVYADLALTYFTLGAVGFLYLWLSGAAPAGTLPLAALFFAGLPWSKFEGPPLAGTILLAAALTLLWLKPPRLTRRLASLCWPLFGLLLGYLPWRLFALLHGIETGADHMLGFYFPQLIKAAPALLAALIYPTLFGILWPATALAAFSAGKRLFTTPQLFLVLFLAGNFAAILLAYAVAPTSPAEFHLYLRATIDRLILHLTPAAALLMGEGLKGLMLREPKPVSQFVSTR
jgi:hypothetical protein